MDETLTSKIATGVAVAALLAGALSGHLAEGVLGAIGITMAGRLAELVKGLRHENAGVAGGTSYVEELADAQEDWLHKASARAYYAHERDIPAYTVTSNMPVARESDPHGDDDMFSDLQGSRI